MILEKIAGLPDMLYGALRLVFDEFSCMNPRCARSRALLNVCAYVHRKGAPHLRGLNPHLAIE